MNDKVTKIKEQILEVLKSVKREGMDKLLEFLESGDFFTAPASTKYHCAYPGGLAEHSWNVYVLFKEKIRYFNLDVSDDSAAICAILHDLCKTDFYYTAMRNVKENGKWVQKEGYSAKDKLPFGHSEKSVYLIQRYIALTDIEALAIRWHMGFTEPKDHWNKMHDAMAISPAVAALHTADLESSFLVEER
ncbi:MAG: hypothetical protein HQK83_05740 [Fibrobacteria bacterium]|nr:hypothetical protein [Fibrobacteria bacterium]